MLKGKKILIGITGSIAAYKIPILVRLLIKEGAQVKVLMTSSACDFVTPLTLSTLSQNPVYIEPFNKENGSWTSHIELGSWADALLLAPLSANTLAKVATGITDNLLTASYLAARCPVFFAPAMDMDMFQHITTQRNITTLLSFGHHLIAPTSGELASGLTGFGRMEEPENIVMVLNAFFAKQQTLSGKKVLITSGPTVEAIDAVRYISNHSSGKMGNALALEAAMRGAQVTLISGPVKSVPEHPNIHVIRITTAAELYDQCASCFPGTDITIMASAVADYYDPNPAPEKLKKTDEPLVLKLEKTQDILAALGKQKASNQTLVGFALETEDEINNATKKLNTKNLDYIVLNSLKNEGAGFSTPTNQVSILDKQGGITHFSLKTKERVATDIFDFILKK